MGLVVYELTALLLSSLRRMALVPRGVGQEEQGVGRKS
jgi:hypothetical protein